MNPPTDREPVLLVLLFGLSAAVTVLLHAVFVFEYLPEAFVPALPYLVAGWASFALSFYALGRLLSSPAAMPNLRALDAGVATFLGSVILSGILDAAGITVEAVPIAHALPAIGVYVGLGLAGWGFGERARAIERITAGNGA